MEPQAIEHYKTSSYKYYYGTSSYKCITKPQATNTITKPQTTEHCCGTSSITCTPVASIKLMTLQSTIRAEDSLLVSANMSTSIPRQ